MDKELFVIAKPVQFVKDRKVLCLVCIERSREHYAIGNAASKDLTGNRIAFNAPGGGGRRNAKKEDESGEQRVANGEAKRHKDILLITEGLDGIEAGGTRRGIQTGGKADKNGKENAKENKPQGDRGNVHAGNILTMQIDVSAKSDSASNKPAKNGADDPSEETHDTRLDEKKLLYVAVGRTKRLQNANFAAALKHRHDKRVDNPESSYSKSHTAKDAEENVQNGEKAL